MIYRCLCKCPNNHIIEGMIAPFDREVVDQEKARKAIAEVLKAYMLIWIHDGKLGDKCEICRAPLKEFKFVVDAKDSPHDEGVIQEIWEEITPELMKQRALRHARKNAN